MHELWLCNNILEIINQHVAGKLFKRIKKIYLEIGELAAVEKSALFFSFNVIAQGTIAKDAVLEIITIPGKARCDACQKMVKVSQYADSCPHCASFSLNILQGEELRVKSLEIE